MAQHSEHRGKASETKALPPMRIGEVVLRTLRPAKKSATSASPPNPPVIPGLLGADIGADVGPRLPTFPAKREAGRLPAAHAGCRKVAAGTYRTRKNPTTLCRPGTKNRAEHAAGSVISRLRTAARSRIHNNHSARLLTVTAPRHTLHEESSQ
jgi:hypothetical protein